MTPIVQLRKDPRAVAAEGPFRRTSQIPTTHIPLSVLKILGLKSAT
jgi:hypothetical protein